MSMCMLCSVDQLHLSRNVIGFQLWAYWSSGGEKRR